MIFQAGSIVGKLELDRQNWTAGMRQARSDERSLRGMLRGITTEARAVTTAIGAIGTAASVAFGAAVREASGIKESENLFKVSLGNMAEDARAWSDQVADAVGAPGYAIRKELGTFNIMLDAMGLNESAALSMSKNFTILTKEISSLYNLPHERAFQKIRAGITGEVEPLKELGIVISETAVKQFAYERGLVRVGQELSEQQKLVARYGLIMERTSVAQGDVTRTANDAENMARRLGGQFAELRKSIAEHLVPDYEKFLRVMNNGLRITRDFIDSNKDLTRQWVRTAAVAASVAGAVGGIAVAMPLLRPGFALVAGVGTLAFTGLAQAAILSARGATSLVRMLGGPGKSAIGQFNSLVQSGSTSMLRFAGNMFQFSFAAGAIGSTINATFKFLPKTILGAVSALAAVGASVYSLRAVWNQNVAGIQKEFGAHVAWLARTWDKTISLGKAAYEAIKTAAIDQFKGMVTGVGEKLTDLVDMAKEAANNVIRAFVAAGKVIEKALNNPIGFATEGIFAEIKEAYSRDYIGELFSADNPIRRWASDQIRLFSEGKDILIENIKAVLPEIAGAIKTQAEQDTAPMAEWLKSLLNLEGIQKDAAGMKDKFRTDFDKIWAELTKDLTADLPALEQPDLKALMDALTGSFDGKGASGSAARSIVSNLDPVKAAISDLRENVKALKKEGLLTESEHLLASDLYEQVSGEGVGAIRAMIDELKTLDAVSGTNILSKFEDVMRSDIRSQLQPESDRLFADIASQIDRIKLLSRPDGETGMLAPAFWADLRSLGEDALTGIIQRMEGMGEVGRMVASDIRDQMQLDSIGRGKAMFGEFTGLDSVDEAKASLADLNAFVTELRTSGELQPGSMNLLAQGFWERFGDAGFTALQQVIDEVPGLREVFAEAIKKIKNDSDDLTKAEKFRETSQALSGIGSALGSLGPKFRGAAEAAQTAGQIMSIAANAVSGNWAAVAVDAIPLVGDALGLVDDKAEETKGVFGRITDEIKNSIDKWADELTDAIVEFVKTGKLEFKEFVDSVLEDLLRITITESITKPLTGAIGGLFAKGAAIDQGNIVPFAKGALVHSPHMFKMAGGKTGVMGEAGPEAIMPLTRTSDGRLGVAAAGMAGNVMNVEIIDQRGSGAPIRVERENGDGYETLRVIVRDINEDIIASGGLDRSMGQNFGAQRQLTRR